MALRANTTAWLAGAVVIGAVFWSHHHNARVYLFGGPDEPDPHATVPKPHTAVVEDFGRGSEHSLAVLVTDRNAAWLGLARGLQAHGIPFTMTTDVKEALRHKVIAVYPIISGRVLHGPDFDALTQHVQGGGSLLSFDVEGGGMLPLFGVAAAPKPEMDRRLTWQGHAPDQANHETRISGTGQERETSFGYTPLPGSETLATLEDGSAGVVCHRQGGIACVLGTDFGSLSARAMNGRGESMARAYANAYEPSLDTLYRWVTKFYVAGEPAPWLIDTVPPGRELTVLLTHDIDFNQAVTAAHDTADTLAHDGVHGTFFMQTKYVRDYNDSIFFTEGALPDLRAIEAEGMEIGSHSVAHAVTFKNFPFGDGHERYPDYVPFVENRYSAYGTVLGELGVSGWLLRTKVGGPVVSFRAGHLSNPFRLPDGLAATSFRNDSSITADACMTHLPFQLTYGRANEALAPVLELPVTIEDEAKPALAQRLPQANAVLRAIARDHGLAVILMHPDRAGVKLAFERSLVAQWGARGWFPTVDEYGGWWRARHSLDAQVVGSNGHWTLKTAANASPMGITILLPKMKSMTPQAGAKPGPGGVAIAGSAQATSIAFH